MTAISPISASATSTASNVVQLLAPAQQATSDSASTAPASHPSDTVSISTEASAAASTPPSIGEANPDAVEDALYDLSGANGFAFNLQHIDFAGIARDAGQAIADRDYDSALHAAIVTGGNAEAAASGLGISTAASAGATAVANGTDPGQLSIANFSFTNGGSTYTVTNGANGTLVGTKDGQAWLSLQFGYQYSNAATQTSTGESIAAELLKDATTQNTGFGASASIDIAA